MGRIGQAVGLLLVAVPVLWAVGAIVTTVVVETQDNFSYRPEFNNKVHGHIENAYYANTPEFMIQELEAAEDGMRELGLDEGDWCDMRPWKQTPSCSMAYQYDHLDSIINRARDVQKWRDTQQAGADQLNDVYGAKMSDLRSFIKEDGWSDDVALNAYYVEHHPFYAAWWDFAGVALGGWFGSIIVLGAPGLFLLFREG